MLSKKLLLFLLVSTFVFYVCVPVARHLIQRYTLASNLQQIMIDYNLSGRNQFEDKVYGIISRSGVATDRVKIKIREDLDRHRMSVEIHYVSEMKLLGLPVNQDVIIRSETPMLEL